MTGILIEGVDSTRMRLKPGFYVRQDGDLLAVADPVHPERVRDSLALSAEPRRSLIAVGSDGVPHVLSTITRWIEIEQAGGWSADVILLPHGQRGEPVSITLPVSAGRPETEAA